MALLLKSGKQILGLSAAAVKCQKQLGISGRAAAASKYHVLTTTRIRISSDHGRFLCANNNNNINIKKYFSTNTANDKDFEIPPPMTLKRVFSRLFRKRRYSSIPQLLGKLRVLAEQSKSCPDDRFPKVLDDIRPISNELIGAFMKLAEESKCCPEHRLPGVLDAIRPILDEMLNILGDEDLVRFVNEYARQAASPSSPVRDKMMNDILKSAGPHVVNLFQDLMIRMFYKRFEVGSGLLDDPRVDHSKSVVFTANLSPNRKEFLQLFVLDNLLMVSGTRNPVLPAPYPTYAHVLPLEEATIHQVLLLPVVPESHNKITASILEPGQVKIVFSCHDETEASVVKRPRVFQLNLDTQGTPQC